MEVRIQSPMDCLGMHMRQLCEWILWEMFYSNKCLEINNKFFNKVLFLFAFVYNNLLFGSFEYLQEFRFLSNENTILIQA